MITYQFILTEIPKHKPYPGAVTDKAWCDWQGEHYEAISRHGVTCKLSRMLVAAGAPDGLIEVFRMPRGAGSEYSIRSLHEWAKYTVEDRKDGGLSLRLYTPTPVEGCSKEAA